MTKLKKHGWALASLLLAGAAALATSPVHASAVNVALITDGASFVSASSSGLTEIYTQIPGLQPVGPTAAQDQINMQNNLLLNAADRIAVISNGDTRYFFSSSDAAPTLIIDLGKLYDLTSFGATWGGTDRAPAGGVTVSYGSSPVGAWTTIGSSNTFGEETVVGSINARYLEYTFGNSGQYPGFGGSAIIQLFANTPAVPEPATWAMMIVGFAGMGLIVYRRRSRPNLRLA